MSRGPKRLPEEKHRLRGTYRKDRANPKRAKADRVLVAECPVVLQGVAAAEWDRVVSELVGMGILAAIDTMMLAVYCMEFAEYVDAMRTLEESGRTVVISDKDGNVRDLRNHPAVARANMAFRNLRSMGSEFGLTPVSRERITVPEKPQPDDELTLWKKKKAARRSG